MKIIQPRLRPSYTKAQSLYACIDEDNYVEGMEFDGITISNEEYTALHLDGVRLSLMCFLRIVSLMRLI